MACCGRSVRQPAGLSGGPPHADATRIPTNPVSTTAAPTTAAPPGRLSRLVIALGTGTVFSYGTLYYAIAVLWPPIAADLGIGKSTLFGVVSASLLVNGLFAPRAGRWIDAHGGRRLMVGGAVVSAIAMLMLALAQGLAGYVAGWLVGGFAMSLTLYEAAFGTLAQHAGAAYRRALTALTLIGGFASTVFWPLSAWLLDAIGWRATFGVFAAMHLAICAPIYAWAIPPRRDNADDDGKGLSRTGPTVAASGSTPEHAVQSSAGCAPARTAAGGEQAPRAVPAAAAPAAPGRSPVSPRVFAWLSLAFAMLAFVMSAISTHLPAMLQARGLGLADAVLIGMAIGPMQVAGRIVDLVASARLDAFRTGYLAFASIVIGMALLVSGGPSVGAGILFAAFYGAGNGLQTIVKGMAVAELFGRDAYAGWLGRIGRWTLLTHAAAPFVVAALIGKGVDYARVPWLLLAASIVALVCFRIAIVSHRR